MFNSRAAFRFTINHLRMCAKQCKMEPWKKLEHLTLSIYFVMESKVILFTFFLLCFFNHSYSCIACLCEYTKTARGRNKRKTSPLHRLGLTHNRDGIPKFIRENTAQFFSTVANNNTTVEASLLPQLSREFERLHQHQHEQIEIFKDDEKQNILFTKPVTPIFTLPPISTANSRRSKVIPSASVCTHPQTIHSPILSSGLSLESSSPLIESPELTPTVKLKRQCQHSGPVDKDIFRKAYERALSVARSRLLYRDPYSLTRANATHGVLYSYYDHTPMCIFSHGVSCNHNQDKTSKQDPKLKANILRKKIFDDVIVERYIQ